MQREKQNHIYYKSSELGCIVDHQLTKNRAIQCGTHIPKDGCHAISYPTCFFCAVTLPLPQQEVMFPLHWSLHWLCDLFCPIKRDDV